MSYPNQSSELQFYTLQQLRAATQAGGVASIVLKAQGNGFFIQIHTRSAQTAVLVTARGQQPRQFKNPIQAFSILRKIGVVVGHFDLTHYSPEQRETSLNLEQPTSACPNSIQHECEELVDEPQESAQGSFDYYHQ